MSGDCTGFSKVKGMSYEQDHTKLCFTQTHYEELTIQKNCRTDLSERALKQISLTFNKYVMKFDFKMLHFHKLIHLSYEQTCKIKH